MPLGKRLGLVRATITTMGRLLMGQCDNVVRTERKRSRNENDHATKTITQQKRASA